MNLHRNQLPQLSNDLFITDGGLETTLIFHHGYELPDAAAFDLLKHAGGYETLRDYYRKYIDLAAQSRVGFILESATWRASRSWGAGLGYEPDDMREINRALITMLIEIRKHAQTENPMVISGCIGPKGDGYQVTDKMTPAEAAHYHYEQIRSLADAGADLVSAFTMNYAEEAMGITRAARQVNIPVVIGFTVEADGHLPSGQGLKEAVLSVDQATGNGPAYYMINCAHPSHFAHVLSSGGRWVERIRAIRPNASSKSHDELDNSDTLDAGDPRDLADRCAALKKRLPHLNVFGGCCGTDHRHVEQIRNAVTKIAA